MNRGSKQLMEHLVFYFQIQVDKVTSQVSKNTVEENYGSNYGIISE